MAPCEWSNDMILEFISCLKMEIPSWNSSSFSAVERNRAWENIQNNLSFKCTLQELKRKKDSLMAYYRFHLGKIKKAREEGEEFTTTWFAFQALDEFLRPMYLNKRGSECGLEERETDISTDNYETFDDIIIVKHDPAQDPFLETNEDDTSELVNCEADVRTHHGAKRRIVRPPSAGIKVRKIQEFKPAPAAAELGDEDEYDIFGKLIAKKIRKLQSRKDKEELMLNIHKLVFKTTMCEFESIDD